MITPVLINRIGWKTYLIFMILLALFVPFVYFCYPETSGLSLEEIDNIFLPEDKQVRKLSYAVEGGLLREGSVTSYGRRGSNVHYDKNYEKRNSTDYVEKV